nr:dynein light chain 1, cytoplasmic-like [Lytechinus pictus]
MNRGYSGMSNEKDKAVVKNADMGEEMQEEAIKLAMDKLGDKQNKPVEKDVAAYIKKEFDNKYDSTWHCVVGRNFGSFVTHEKENFTYFYIGQTAILLFKSG